MLFAMTLDVCMSSLVVNVVHILSVELRETRYTLYGPVFTPTRSGEYCSFRGGGGDCGCCVNISSKGCEDSELKKYTLMRTQLFLNQMHQ